MWDSRPDRSAEIVLVGRSNVGKSTVMRELTGHSIPTGRRPGVTREPNHFDWNQGDFVLTDLPGFGFMSGVSSEQREAIKTAVVRYLEEHAASILVAVLVLDGKSAVDVIDRHEAAGDIPYDIEMYSFLADIGVPTVIAVNKMDKVDDRDDRLNEICERFGLAPPWQQWRDTIAPITAKRGSIEALRSALRERLSDQDREDLFAYV